jgi:hypothetical protein
MARDAASGWSPGAPKRTWIASPMILATVPSCANTILVESLDPRQLASLLSGYLEGMTEAA